jgi:hypothetical protein
LKLFLNLTNNESAVEFQFDSIIALEVNILTLYNQHCLSKLENKSELFYFVGSETNSSSTVRQCAPSVLQLSASSAVLDSAKTTVQQRSKTRVFKPAKTTRETRLQKHPKATVHKRCQTRMHHCSKVRFLPNNSTSLSTLDFIYFYFII